MNKLTPCFRDRAVLLVPALKLRGYNVQVWETYRSPERVKELAARGTGSAWSVHPYGVAIDIVENDRTPWDPSDPGLWDAITIEAEALGLYRVRRGKTKTLDGPHVQALAPYLDRAVARMHAQLAPGDFDAWVRSRMARIAP
jgi:hypothetical protein